MTKHFYAFFTTILFSSLAFGQSAGRIEGKLTRINGDPIGFATVILFQAADSTIAKTGFTTEDGQFILAPLAAGKYKLLARFSGLEPYSTETLELAQNQVLVLDEVQMKELETQLDEVEIVARKPLVEIRPDMTVFNVAGNTNAIGENAFELLRKAPGVILDNNDNIILMGKSGVRIYIDGKPSPLTAADLANMLRGMQSDQIEAIEIITNPSARYDAEGNAGIINIKLKKNQNHGTNGSATLGYAVGRFSKYNGSLTLNNRNSRLNVFGSYSGGLGTNYFFTDFYRVQNGLVFDQHSDRFNEFANHNFKAGIDYFIDKNRTIGFMVNGFAATMDMEAISLSDISAEATGEPISVLAALSDNRMPRSNVNYNLNYSVKGEDGSSWNVDLDYGDYSISNNSFQPNFFLDPTQTDTLSVSTFSTYTPTDIDIYTIKADHERTFWKGKLSLGAKIAYIETDNDFNFSDVVDGETILNLDRSNRFAYDENINALYFTFQRQLKKFNLELGLRTEQTNTTGKLFSVQETGLDTVTRHYIDFFPTAGITYNLNPKNSVRVNYSRRIDRPRYQNLNPFEFQLDQLTFQRGNPFLRPQYTNSVQLTHTFNYRYSTTVSYSLTNDYFTQITDTFGTEASFITEENLATREVIGLNISAPVTLAKWWSVYSNVNVNRTRNTGNFNLPGEEGKDVDVARTTFNLYQQHTFTLPKNFSVEVSGFYNSPSIWGANYLTDEFWGINMGVQHRFMKNKAVVKVSVSDIFNSMQWSGDQNFGGLFFRASGRWESQQFKVNMTFNFGNDKVKASRRRKTGMDDESKRTSGGGNGPNNN